MTAANLTQVRYVKNNTTYGLPPTGSPKMKLIPLQRETLELQVDNIRSPVIRADRHTQDTFRVGVRENGDIEFPIGYGQADDLYEYGLYSPAWTAADVTSGLTVTVTSGTGTFAATGIGTNVAVGDWVRFSGFASTLITNNGWWKVATVPGSGSITVSGGTGTLVSGTSGATVGRVRGAYIDAAKTASEIYVEKEFGGLSSNKIFGIPGLFIRTLRQETNRKGFFQLRLGFFGKNEDRISATVGDGSPTAVNSNITMNTVDHLIAVIGGGVLDLTRFNWELSNNQEPKEVMGTFGPTGIIEGSIGIRGDLDGYGDDSIMTAIMDKFHDHTEDSFGIVAHDKSASPYGNSYVYDIPAAHYLSARANAEGIDTQVFARSTWEAKTKLEGATNHMMRIFRFAP